jgi:molybdate transport system regulatory protein
LREAARRCGISYRAAWGKLRASEERLGEPLVVIKPGRRGMALTPRARKLLAVFHQIERELDETLADIVARSLRE